jgi:branched-chain amino acid transport system substrate-binding protein
MTARISDNGPSIRSSRGIAPSNAPHAFLEGVRINTTATNAQAITQLKLRRWNGSVWEEFGELMNGADVE